ncbi:MAG TPA: FHA domain-containing protein [Myxococcota bacterium]|nr:FHA domain-containing protein [Myxococcota bacterium]HRY92176.1 FHA domain-containing protein [Myxococcota bacterium]HSA22363.1 FHA domain-containing protein [Myxococcota bacterium]
MDSTSQGPALPRVRDFLQDSRALEEDAFRARHGAAFLLMLAATDELSQPGDVPQWTMGGGAPAPRQEAAQSDLDQAVLPVRHRRADSRKALLSVGRADSCDVVVPDLSVSLVHAFFREEAEGGFSLVDGGSKNGTFVEGKRVAPQGKGAPASVGAGSEVRIGNVRFMFLTCSLFRHLLRQFVG